MLAVLNTLFINGIEAQPVKVEVDIQNGLPDFQIVGLASMAIKEARERVRSAIKNCNYKFPYQKIIVNLAPADLKKEGTHFDLAIALGILIASEQVKAASEQLYYLAGELSLDGSVREVPGILPMALELMDMSHPVQFLIPAGNTPEAALVNELASLPVQHLTDVIRWVEGDISLDPVRIAPPAGRFVSSPGDFSEVKGQETAKRALQIAAAGMHNALLIGPPGGGKTMLARRVVSIFPEMSRQEVLESTRIYSVANLLNKDQPLINSRPFRSPHKNASSASIVGGGRIPRPGEISLAQNGVLFLDELPEFNRDVLEALRQPLEDKVITVARAQGTYTFPANFILIGSMNPCPCGNFGSQLECRCTPMQINKYLNRISGPLLDRMDLHVELPRVNFEQLKDHNPGKTSAQIKEKVTAARALQESRFAGRTYKVNALMDSHDVKRYCSLNRDAEQLLKSAFQKLNLSARGYNRILKVARTIADLENEAAVQIQHLAEALQYRSLDKKYWMV